MDFDYLNCPLVKHRILYNHAIIAIGNQSAWLYKIK